MPMKFYGYTKCSTCRNAMKWLDEHGVEYTLIPIIEKPPTRAEFKTALAAGFTMRNLFNTSGIQYREQGMKAKLDKMSDAEALKALGGNGYFVKRPFAIDGKRVTLGFKPDKYAEAWG
ncbi:MAG: arsenate reductase family protein [Phycisphaerales bacterium JB063]